MTYGFNRPAACALAFFALFASALPLAQAQSASAIPRLDLDQFVAPWFEIARYPIKKEKSCMGDELVLFALNDKKNTFQRVTSCKMKGDNTNSWNANGKLAADGSGRLKVRTLLFFTTSYWVLANGPSYKWVLIGTPNHKSVWILSKTPSLAPDQMSEAQAKAAAAGFDTARLIKIEQHPENHQTQVNEQSQVQHP